METRTGKVKRDDSGVRTSYANVLHVCCTREEVALLFGVSHARQVGQKEPTAKINNCVILTPFSAKRFAALLKDFLRDYESRYGPPKPGSPPATGAGRGGSSLPVWENASENVHRLTRLIQDLGVPYGLERSFKVFHGALLRKRFLMSLSKDSLQPEAQERVLNICRQLDMPEEFYKAFTEKLSYANYVHFGFEEGESSSLYKAYLEFWTDWEQEIFSRPHRSDPFLLHLGLKWDVSDNTRRALTRYTCHPHLSTVDILERLSKIYSGSEHVGGLDVAKGILDMASCRIDHEQILYLEVTEENNPRVSFDMNIYKAKIRLRELDPLLSEMCRYYSIPSEEFDGVYDGIENEFVGHISGGIDREGRDFLTIYYGVEGH